MTYNFDEIIDRRHTNALNTDGFRGYIFHAGPEKVFAFKDEEFVRMWVADMEFAVAPEILDALRARIDRRNCGAARVRTAASSAIPACMTTNITARSPSGAAITMTGAFPRSSCASRRASSRRSTS